MIKTLNLKLYILLFCTITNVYAQLEYKFKVEPENQIFPSLIASTQTINITKKQDSHKIGDLAGLIGVEIKTDEDISGSLTVSSSSIINSSTINFKIKSSTQSYSITPILDYNFKSLYATKQPQPELIKFSLKINGKKEILQTKKVMVRSINDCPIAYKNDNGKINSFNLMFAAYVNENHPIVDEVLKKALATKIVSSFKGYQGTPKEVVEEIFAVWNALQRENIKYSSITTSSGFSDKVYSQHVRFIQDTYKNSQANCVDGSVFLASIFTKLGLHTALVFPPGHCFLAIYTADPTRYKNAKILYLETTLIGSVDLKKPSLDRVMKFLASGRKNNLSRTSFENAVQQGIQNMKNIKKWNKNTMISIPLARKFGIIPLVDNQYN